MKIIAFIGQKRSGKDTCAKLMKRAHVMEHGGASSSIHHLSFASPMKKQLASLLCVEESVFHDQRVKELPVLPNNTTPRAAMQWFGSSMKQKFGKDFWVEKMRASIKALPGDAIVLVTDCRFVEEVTMLNDLGAYFVYLSRDLGNEKMEDCHESERSVRDAARWCIDNADDRFDSLVNNFETLEELYPRVETLFDKYIK